MMRVYDEKGRLTVDFKAHGPKHESGGVDEIDISGLEGESAELASHKALPDDHHDRQHDHSLSGDGSPIAMAGLPDLDQGKVWLGNAGNRPEAETFVAVPSGVIAMWSGTLANIPSGWVLCDGNNSTPNLLARFIRQVPDASTDPGGTGGSDSVSLSVAQLASHYHYMANTSGPGSSPSTGSFVLDRKPPNQIATSSTGSGSSHENRPAYYQLAFIMKT
jgi:microcystin-dependent protein